MESIDPHDLTALSLDDLRHLQRTLERRFAARDRGNLVGVGFGPRIRRGQLLPGLAARVLVRQKTPAVPAARRVQPTEPVRLLDRSCGRFRRLDLATDVLQAAPPRAVGVRLFGGSGRATAAAVIRWTTRTPPPPSPHAADIDDPRWRWGLLTVAHLFHRSSGGSSATRSGRPEVRIERVSACGGAPSTIEGSVAAVGRLPGGPDAAVVETGLDRLWLSGFLPDPAASPASEVSAEELLGWLRKGAEGYVHAAGRVVPWRFATYLPEQFVPGLGRLQHLIQFTAAAEWREPAPFGPGSSGAMLVSAGAPLGMQIAAESPAYHTGYAQWMAAVGPWLQKALGASQLAVVRVV